MKPARFPDKYHIYSAKRDAWLGFISFVVLLVLLMVIDMSFGRTTTSTKSSNNPIELRTRSSDR